MKRFASVRFALALVAAGLLVLASPDLLSAQASQLPGTTVGQQSLRPYWHVFIAYSIVIALIGGWAFSIARRLRAIEDRLVD
jgi:CcmD family protein